ncbi:peptide/nickel transport system permease protein [Desulfonispora thiosulfatigenes DSM 11270]|uniref:Peptide/nickel transport system permease protein n=1 Tax=Desulfonispora thiosulfatigenes DSM 11270 TaxID=656914 RepID=A0A1W1V8B3_DESTI|nr:ABC transporter permease [Desulfonispora thiosulfatigenes]SMB89669.1 peptide/nickel transport system permease protein [Desulfonispora thiosulfatigenes DSM 11270]
MSYSNLKKMPKAVLLALISLGSIILIVTIGPMLIKFDPIAVDLSAIYQAPNSNHLLGTDSLGRDILIRLIYGGRVSVVVGIVSVIISTTFGTVYGALSGYVGGILDSVLMRILDAILALPNMILVIVIQAITGAGLANLVLVIGFTSWMQTARMVRAEVLSLKERDFVKVSKVLGTPWWRIITKHLIPHALPTIIVVSTVGVGHAIMSETTLSFLGLGIPPHEPSWGNMLMGGQNSILRGSWWITLFPGLAIISTVLSIIYIGDYLQVVLNPKIKSEG